MCARCGGIARASVAGVRRARLAWQVRQGAAAIRAIHRRRLEARGGEGTSNQEADLEWVAQQEGGEQEEGEQEGGQSEEGEEQSAEDEARSSPAEVEGATGVRDEETRAGADARAEATAVALRSEGDRRRQLRAAKEATLAEVYRLLALHLGTPPASFRWGVAGADGVSRSWEILTPREFARRFVTPVYRPADKVYLQHDPRHAYFTLWSPTRRSQFAERRARYLNVPIDEMLGWTAKSILAGEPVWFGCDVHRQSDVSLGIFDEGLIDLGTTLRLPDASHMDKRARLESGTSASSHAMLLVGVDLAPDGEPDDREGGAARLARRVRKLRIENSWGDDTGDGGRYTMSAEWFRQNVFHVAVDRRFLPRGVVAKLRTLKPRPLVRWDPMASVGCARRERRGRADAGAAARASSGWRGPIGEQE